MILAKLPRHAGLFRESLYKALSGERRPSFDTVLKVIAALGLTLHAEAAYGYLIATRAHTVALVQQKVRDDITLHFLSARSLHHPEPASLAAYVLTHGVAITP